MMCFSHDRYKNFDGPSSLIERNIILEGFKSAKLNTSRSLAQYIGKEMWYYVLW